MELRIVLSLLFLAGFTTLFLRFFAEKKIDYIKSYLKVSIFHLLAICILLLFFGNIIISRYHVFSLTFLFFFIISFGLISFIFTLIRPIVKKEISTKYQQAGVYVVAFSPYYVISKSLNILFQQILIASSIFLLKDAGIGNLQIIALFAIVFGIAHIVLVDRRKPMTVFIDVASFFGGAIFAFLILSFPFGLLYTYSLHWFFIILLGIVPYIKDRKNSLT